MLRYLQTTMMPVHICSHRRKAAGVGRVLAPGLVVVEAGSVVGKISNYRYLRAIEITRFVTENATSDVMPSSGIPSGQTSNYTRPDVIGGDLNGLSQQTLPLRTRSAPVGTDSCMPGLLTWIGLPTQTTTTRDSAEYLSNERWRHEQRRF